jgi:uncharacterized protein YoaH (UPF0181 family)
MLYNVSVNYQDTCVEAVCYAANLSCAGMDSQSAVSKLTKAIRFYHQADNDISFRIRNAPFNQLP